MAIDTHISSRNDLRLTSLSLHSFRNYSEATFSDFGDLTVFIGPNAVGKTSIIEAIQLLTALKSFRSTKALQMVQWGSESARISTQITNQQRQLDLLLTIEQGKRRYQLNGKAKRIQDLKGLLPAVTFYPDDLHIVKGSHSTRLTMVDDIGTQLSKNFYAVKKDYTRLIQQKNKALKQHQNSSVLDSFDELIIKVGTQYLSHRMFVIERLQEKIQYFYTEISGQEEQLYLLPLFSWDKPHEEHLLSIYQSSSSVPDLTFNKEEITTSFTQALTHIRQQEIVRERSLIGPHADHLFFLLNHRNATHFASQGQQRSIVLALKLAEAALVQDILHQNPVLLLDDVMSELDEQRRNRFLDLTSQGIQTFITTTNSGYFTDQFLKDAQLISLPLKEG